MYSLCYNSRPEATDMFSQFVCTLGLLYQLRQEEFLTRAIDLLNRLGSCAKRLTILCTNDGRAKSEPQLLSTFCLPKELHTMFCYSQHIFVCDNYCGQLFLAGCRVTAIHWLGTEEVMCTHGCLDDSTLTSNWRSLMPASVPSQINENADINHPVAHDWNHHITLATSTN